MPRYDDLSQSYGANLDKIYDDHNQIIGTILEQEEGLIERHKQHVNDIINIEKEEMQLIQDVDKTGSDVEEYINRLDKFLLTKLEKIVNLRKDLFMFNSHL